MAEEENLPATETVGGFSAATGSVAERLDENEAERAELDASGLRDSGCTAENSCVRVEGPMEVEIIGRDQTNNGSEGYLDNCKVIEENNTGREIEESNTEGMEAHLEDSSEEGSLDDEDETSGSDKDEGSTEALSDEEVQKLVDQLLQAESEAAEAQEALEEESLERLKQEVRAELAETVSEDGLDAAVSEEMAVFTEDWENTLASLEDQSALLQERLEDAGISLPDIFKWIEKQASEGCTTEAWKKRVHWAGIQMPQDFVEALTKAEEDLDYQRPVQRRRGRLVEEGASGFLKRKVPTKDLQTAELAPDTDSGLDGGWCVLDDVFTTNLNTGCRGLTSSKEWVAVYAASTPEQAARMGLNLPGVDKVEEIGDISESQGPAYAIALEEESAHGLTEQQKRSLKRVREEDDVKRSRWLNKNISWKRRQTEHISKKARKDRSTWAKSNISNSKDPVAGTSAAITEIGCAFVEQFVSLRSEFPVVSNKISACETDSALKLSKDRDIIVLSDDEGGINGDFEMRKSTESSTSKKKSISRKDSSIHLMDETQFSIVTENKEECRLPSMPVDSAAVDGEKVREIEETPKLLWASSGYRHRKKIKTAVIDTDSDRDDNGSTIKTTDLECADTLPFPDETKDLSGHFKGPHAERNEARETEVASFKSSRKRLRQGKRGYECTICLKGVAKSQVSRHPILEVIACKTCKCAYESAPFSKDEDGSECECRWCGEGGELVCCDFCDKAFCEQCISRNVGEDKLKEILQIDWKCLFCDASPLISFARKLREAESEGSDSQQAESDDDLSDAKGADMIQHRKVSRRRNIRKVMDDEELSEQTKIKILLEKERQDRLQKWYESAKENNSSKMSKNLHATAVNQTRNSDEQHQFCDADCKMKGCIVNGARAPTEEIVRIPPSISKSLRPHQLSGVRFMWENCIESVTKVKSGDSGLGCILAHSMGLGKTLQVIAFLYTILKHKDLGLKTVLIVVPVNVLHNWRSEFLKWQPIEVDPISVFMLDDVGRNNFKRAKLLNRWQKLGGVMLIGYTAFRLLSLGKHVRDKLTRDMFCDSLQNPGPDILVCDEAHMIKNSKTDVTQVLKQVRTQRRIALTGSPLQNNLMEYYCMVDFVREGFLGRANDFRNRFQNPIENGQHADSTIQDVKTMKQRAHVLHQQLKGFVQRKDTTVLKDELPSKSVWVISVRLSELQRRLYTRFLEAHGCFKADGKIRRSFLFYAYHSLAKIWNHPDLLWLAKEEKDAQGLDDGLEDFIVDTDEENSSEDNNFDRTDGSGKGKTRTSNHKKIRGVDEMHEIEVPEWWKDILDGNDREVVDHSGKMMLLLRLLSMSSACGDKVLVFSQSLHTLDLIETFLEHFPCDGRDERWKRGREWYRLDGQTSAALRQKIVERFNDVTNVNIQCVLISTRAGSLGINLPAANRVIIVDGSWNPTHDLQALFRVWRFGQTKPVYAYRLLAYGTMEEKIYNRQLTKEGLAARVLDEHQVGRHLNEKDLEFLFTLDDDPDADLYFENSIKSEGMKNEATITSVCPGPDQIEVASSSDLLVNASAHLAPSGKHLLGFATPGDAPPRDEFMAMLLLEFRPRWIVKYHEHEPLLEDLEDEKLTKEEQIQAWEAFKRGHEVDTAEGQTHPVGPYLQIDGQPGGAIPLTYFDGGLPFLQTKSSPCDATKHVRLLHSLNIKMHAQTFCNDCLQNIGWEDLVKKKKNCSMKMESRI
ncbi:hypothetical protein O6H91_01G082600 [Diphasiastrum complanatum]|uniref:Uncharacterized protein n=2 Tax=Diphasiastrum complanatum TaxID=34168 RepID=A0ACC2ESQ0_DIPCM|nr:hypothetical protein O6H91_01G082600 [Diphasiastrum complanatum]